MIVFFSAIIFSILGYQLYEKEIANTKILQIQNLDLQSLVESQDTHILYYLAGFFLLQVASLIVLGILLTHRIAGPVFRVHKYLDDLAQSGEIKPLDTIRSRDEFHQFFESLSTVINRLKAKNDQQKALVGELQRAVEAAKKDPSKIDHCRQLCRELSAIL